MSLVISACFPASCGEHTHHAVCPTQLMEWGNLSMGRGQKAELDIGINVTFWRQRQPQPVSFGTSHTLLTAWRWSCHAGLLLRTRLTCPWGETGVAGSPNFGVPSTHLVCLSARWGLLPPCRAVLVDIEDIRPHLACALRRKEGKA